MMNDTEKFLPHLSTAEEFDAMLKEQLKAEQFLSDYKWFDVDISNNMFDVTLPFEKPKFTLAYKGIPFAPLGGIHAFTGQSGNGKTMTITQFIVTILKGEYGDLTYELKDDIPEPKVLYIDTEMELVNTQYVNARVYELMGWSFGTPHEEFKIMMLREETKAETRWLKTLKAIYKLKPNVVFIDGLLDLTTDFNNNAECQELIYNCMATASHYNISLWCVVHENPGNTTKLVGHLGSMLERKVSDIFATRKNKDNVTGIVTFEVQQKKARAKDVDPLLFRVVDGHRHIGIPEQIITPEPPTPEKQEENEKKEINDFFLKMNFDQGGKSKTNIYDCAILQNIRSHKKVDKLIEKALSYDIISKSDKGRYYYHGLFFHPEATQEDLFQQTEEEAPF